MKLSVQTYIELLELKKHHNLLVEQHNVLTIFLAKLLEANPDIKTHLESPGLVTTPIDSTGQYL